MLLDKNQRNIASTAFSIILWIIDVINQAFLYIVASIIMYRVASYFNVLLKGIIGLVNYREYYVNMDIISFAIVSIIVGMPYFAIVSLSRRLRKLKKHDIFVSSLSTIGFSVLMVSSFTSLYVFNSIYAMYPYESMLHILLCIFIPRLYSFIVK